MNQKDMELMVTLWPSFPHFEKFANDKRLTGIRLNSAMMSCPELDVELERVRNLKPRLPLFYDIKARQLRVESVHANPYYLDITLNHPVSVDTPTPVLFKAGEDAALLERLEEGGKRLIFQGGPRYKVKAGESLHIRDKSLIVKGEVFLPNELEKIEKVRNFGFRNYFLSYVEDQKEVDQFLELVGHDSLVYLKIESKKGLEYVAKKFVKKPNLVLVAARGDLFVEIDRPHEIMASLKLIIEKDPEAQVGSRMLLSIINKPVPYEILNALKLIIEKGLGDQSGWQLLLSIIHKPVPSTADLLELAWLYDIGYRKAMLCDEICLKDEWLSVAVDVFDNFRRAYIK